MCDLSLYYITDRHYTIFQVSNLIFKKNESNPMYLM